MSRYGGGVDLVSAIATVAPDPDDAARRAERFIEVANTVGIAASELDADERRVLTLACQRAPYLATLLTRDPDRLRRVARDPYLRREKPWPVVRDELQRQIDDIGATPVAPKALAAALRRVRGDELVRLGVRELELGRDTEVGRELSRLADACFDVAIACTDASLRARYGAPTTTDDDGNLVEATFCVIGMGKLGGDELNFSSDVDVIYVYSTDDRDEAGRSISLHEYFTKLATAVTTAISEPTEDDLVFRVDLRLRPEGSRGAIALSLAAMERYYESFGRPWERQAWLKARPCAGDAKLGEDILATMRPFVYPRYTSLSIVDDVQQLNRRIKQELVAPGAHAGFDVKNGAGGIREIEFFVQALQLIHAGRGAGLRARGTLAELDQLLFAGLVSDDEHLALYSAYRWLRHVEHVLQLDSGRQTQTLPADPTLRAVMARRLGFADTAALEAELARHTHKVAALFATLGANAAPDEDAPTDDDAHTILRGNLAEGAELAALERLGFTDPAAARHELERARRRPGSPLSPSAVGVAARVGPRLLAEIATSADPDAGLRYVVDLVSRRGEGWSMWQLLDETPALRRLLISLFGASAYLARSLVERPELIDFLVHVGIVAPPPSLATLGADLDRKLAATPTEDVDEDLPWATLAEFKNGQVLRIGISDFAGALDAIAVTRELTLVAEVCLRRAVELVRPTLVSRHGIARDHEGNPATLAVLGLGKIGGGELGYGSDLDVVFVYSADGESDGSRKLATVEYMSRWAQRLMSALHTATPRGRLYEIDARLRPSGSSGLLVSSLEGWLRYHQGEARLWERQALIKLRPVAGDVALGEQVLAHAHRHIWGESADAIGGATKIAEELRSMRDRIEKELGPSARGQAPSQIVDLKTGRGGLIDIEFAAQYLQLVHGHAHPSLRVSSTLAALRAAAELALIPHATFETLDQGYRFLRLVEHRLRVVNDQSIHRLPASREELDKLARRTGFPAGDALLDRVDRWRSEIRTAYDRAFD